MTSSRGRSEPLVRSVPVRVVGSRDIEHELVPPRQLKQGSEVRQTVGGCRPAIEPPTMRQGKGGGVLWRMGALLQGAGGHPDQRPDTPPGGRTAVATRGYWPDTGSGEGCISNFAMPWPRGWPRRRGAVVFGSRRPGKKSVQCELFHSRCFGPMLNRR